MFVLDLMSCRNWPPQPPINPTKHAAQWISVKNYRYPSGVSWRFFLPPAASHAQNPCCPASVLPKLSCGSKLDPHRVCGRTINSTQAARGGLGNVWLSVNWCWGPFQYHRSRNWSDGKCLTLKNTTKRLTPDSLMRVSARHTSGRVSERVVGWVGGVPVFG